MNKKSRAPTPGPTRISEECCDALGLLIRAGESEDTPIGERAEFLATRTDEERQSVCNTATALLDLQSQHRIQVPDDDPVFSQFRLQGLTEFLRAEFGVLPCVTDKIRRQVFVIITGRDSG
jgi:hypothetical protein